MEDAEKDKKNPRTQNRRVGAPGTDRVGLSKFMVEIV